MKSNGSTVNALFCNTGYGLRDANLFEHFNQNVLVYKFITLQDLKLMLKKSLISKYNLDVKEEIVEKVIYKLNKTQFESIFKDTKEYSNFEKMIKELR